MKEIQGEQARLARAAIEHENESRRKYLWRKLYDLRHDCGLVEVGLRQAGLTTFAEALKEALDRAAPEGR